MKLNLYKIIYDQKEKKTNKMTKSLTKIKTKAENIKLKANLKY